jgi:hypothetical protein
MKIKQGDIISMPKILINEKDNTSPGTPGSYANYSVLIPGYQIELPEIELAEGQKVEDIVKTWTPEQQKIYAARQAKMDSNGIYEFSSKQDFENAIGLTDDEKKNGVSIENADGEIHYGKRMAYELLNLGYTVIYRPIKSILEENGITTETFWEIFKDKASYDFRFVCHGMLEANFDKQTFEAQNTRLAEIEADIKKLADIIETVEATEGFEALSAEEKAAAYAEEYDRICRTKALGGEEYDGFWDETAGNGKQTHLDYAIAVGKFTANAEGVIPAYAAQKAVVDAYDEANVTPNVFNTVNSNITKLARYVADDKAFIPGRGDCVALIELYENCYTDTYTTKPEELIIDGINNMVSSIADDGKYCALTVPSVYYKMSGNAVKFPAAFHYLACFMSSLKAGFAEWYAVAGYTRGVSSYVIDHTSVKLGEIAINALEPRNLVDDETRVQPAFACNVIANFRGSYYLWGNRTAHKLGAASGGNDLVASHFLNIRQLCTTIKKQLYVACRRFTFDPNSDALWFNFVNAITPTLDAMKADQGVRDYKILKVFTDKKATMKAKIRIIPIEAVEDFDLEISLEDSFGETSAVVAE